MEILVIGYGNTLRRDDGLGPRLAERVESWHLPGVRCLERHQLAPELAEPIANADAVIFIDAAPRADLAWQEVAINAKAEILTHASDPGALFALAQALFGRQPRGWTLQVPARDFDLGEELSSQGRAQVETALAEVRKQIEKIQQEGN